tara:strand:- start:1175 stop:1921 length:747 start_codon:yes stop_codon:yes gene_type:complete
MDPLTATALAIGGAKLVGGVIKGVGDYRAMAPSEVLTERIEELQRLQEADALGLTGQERSAYVQAFMDPQRALAAEQMGQSQALSAMAQDSGEQLRRLRAQEEQVQRAQSEAGRQIELLNQQQARAQEQELQQLELTEEQRARAREQALFSMIGGGIQDVGALSGQIIAAEELAGDDAGSFSAAQLQGLGAAYGYNFPNYAPQQPQPFNPAMGGMMFGFPPGMYGYNPQTGLPIQPAAPAAQVGTGEE